MTEEQILKAKDMRNRRNMTWTAIAAELGVHFSTVRRYVLPGERERRRRREAELEKRRDVRVVDSAAVERQARHLMRQIPEDTRDLTALMFGEPLPGRSALDRQQGAA